ncbi:MAG TPA: type VI secretion system tip protein TssI/VgrG [Steroidobacteraceae bacterium]|nr:type VI secretion system tip protein TssI/VgrG [Steroidobacteraceae bacterium]
MPADQASRIFQFTSPLGKDVLLLHRMTGTEALSQPFQWDIDLISEKGDIDADALLGKEVTVAMTLPQGGTRYFHGVVGEFSQSGWLQQYYQYRISVHPWYWLLTRTADCRIFQGRTVPQIFEDVVTAYKFTDYELRLSGTYEPWEYCVQYRETDFNFLSRLLEQEGIYYFFEHEESKHTLVLIDDPKKHKPIPKYEKVPYYAAGGKDTLRERDHLESWAYTKSVMPGSYATTDFDFEKPRLSLAGSGTITRKHEQSSYEIFDYPAELSAMTPKQSEVTATVRIEELQSTYMVAHGHGNAAGLATGAQFTLEKFPREDLNIAYIITQAHYNLAGDVFESGGESQDEVFSVSIGAVDASTHFRPARRTPKPTVQGAQTAMVVGKSGEEIYTDKYARVKVQFHWDRYGKQDENSSCWVRVAQLWAGKAWGGIHIPRIGQEVIVSFLEGDPDQPIITGRVYNGDSMPPYGLPANATQSGIKSRSSKGGGEANFNEIRFEDLKGSELLHIHAEKDQSIEVEHDESQSIGHDRTETVGHDETITIGNNRTEKVGVNETITIGANRKESVGANETIDIGANRAITVGASESATVALQRTHNVGVNETINVGAAQEINIGAAQTITVGAAQSTTVGADQTDTVAANRSVTVGSDQTVNIGGNLSMTVGADESWSVAGGRTASIGKDDSLAVAKNLAVTAGDSITFSTGDASISMKKDGTITIKGKDITIQGSGKINVKADGDIVMKGSKILQN